MNAVELRSDLHQLIEELDERFLKAVHSMVSVYQSSDSEQEEDPILGYETDGTAVTTSVFLAQAEIAIAEAKAGKGITVEELKKKSGQWLERIK